MITIKLTNAQQSALECRVFDEVDDATLLGSWYVDFKQLRFETHDAADLAETLTEAANAEDAFANHPVNKGTACAKGAIGACRALTNLTDKIIRAV